MKVIIQLNENEYEAYRAEASAQGIHKLKDVKNYIIEDAIEDLSFGHLSADLEVN